MPEDIKPQRTLSWKGWDCSKDGCWKSAAIAETRAKRARAPKGTKPGNGYTAPLPTRVRRNRPSPRTVIQIWIRDNGQCYHCKKNLKPQTVTFDHVIPVSYGGKSHEKNLVLSCGRCNSHRGNKPLVRVEEGAGEEATAPQEIVASLEAGG